MVLHPLAATAHVRALRALQPVIYRQREQQRGLWAGMSNLIRSTDLLLQRGLLRCLYNFPSCPPDILSVPFHQIALYLGLQDALLVNAENKDKLHLSRDLRRRNSDAEAPLFHFAARGDGAAELTTLTR